MKRLVVVGLITAILSMVLAGCGEQAATGGIGSATPPTTSNLQRTVVAQQTTIARLQRPHASTTPGASPRVMTQTAGEPSVPPAQAPAMPSATPTETDLGAINTPTPKPTNTPADSPQAEFADNTPSAQAELSASDGASQDYFGGAVALSGDTALVGAYSKNDFSGVAYVFVRQGTRWTQQAELSVPDPGQNEIEFGYSVALSGDTALVGAVKGPGTRTHYGTGAAYIFVRRGATWTLQATLTASDRQFGYQFGTSVALSGDTAIIGDPEGYGYTGATYIFVRQGTTWTQRAKLLPAGRPLNGFFGNSVALSGDTALIGSMATNNATGAAYIFTRRGATWTQQARLTSSNGTPREFFGSSTALSGDTALIGAYNNNHLPGAAYGAAYIFTRRGARWMQQARLTASDTRFGDQFGYSVALRGDTAFIGSPTSYRPGATYIFVRRGASWIQQAKLTPMDGRSGDWFGASEALSGNTLLTGSPFNNGHKGEASVMVSGSSSAASAPSRQGIFEATVANGGLSRLSGTPDWKSVNGMLMNDGSGYGNGANASWLEPPYTVQGNNYAVEIEAQVTGGRGEFGIILRRSSVGQEVGSFNYPGTPYADTCIMDQIFGTAASCGSWTPDSGWHTFRFEANGSSLRLLVDGVQSYQATDSRQLISGISGIFDTGVQMNVRAIRVIALEPSTTPAYTSTPTGFSAINTPTPEATNTSALPSSGVLYQADWSHGLTGWTSPPGTLDGGHPAAPLDRGWSVRSGMLVSDGSHDSEIMAPYQPGHHGVNDYAVEAKIQIVHGNDHVTHRGFLLLIRMRPDYSAGDDGYGAVAYDKGAGLGVVGHVRSMKGTEVVKPFEPGSGWHTYRVEVQGNHLKFLIDGKEIVTAIESRYLYLSGGWVGLVAAEKSQINVRSFKVIAL